MKKENRISLYIVIVAIIMTILCSIFLPDSVLVQHSTVANVVTYLPKLWAIILADVLSAIGAIGILVSKKEEPQKYNTLFLSVMGIGWLCYMLVINCMF